VRTQRSMPVLPASRLECEQAFRLEPMTAGLLKPQGRGR
jgi:hypothetical protein